MKRLLFVLAAAAALASCPELEPKINLEDAKLNSRMIALTKTEPEFTLKFEIFPENADVIFTWRVDYPSNVVTLTDNGDGSCTIKALPGVTEGEVAIWAGVYSESRGGMGMSFSCNVMVCIGEGETETLTNKALIKAIEEKSLIDVFYKDTNGCVPLIKYNLEEIQNWTNIRFDYDPDSNDVRLTDLSGIEYFTELTSLTLSGHQITVIPDLKSLTKLEKFTFTDNEPTEGVYAAPDGFISKLPSSITGLTVTGLGLTALDVSVLTDLDFLYCYNNQMSALDVSMLSSLSQLMCGRQNGGKTLVLTLSYLQKVLYWDCSPDSWNCWKSLANNENVVLADEAAEAGGSV